MRSFPLLVTPVLLVSLAACGSHEQAASTGSPSTTTQAPKTNSAQPSTATATPPPAPTASSIASSTPGAVPPDGTYERVVVDGVTVPMIEVTDHGNVVLVDTDGKKPRTWEEQYKRKGNIPVGQYDIHKTAKDGKFDGAPVDKEGLWIIDAKGNITRH